MEENRLSSEERIFDFCAYYITKTSLLPVLGRKFIKESQKEKQHFPDFLRDIFSNVLEDINLKPGQGVSELSRLFSPENKNIFEDRLVQVCKEYTPKNHMSRIFPGGVDRAYDEYLQLFTLFPTVYISYYFVRIRLARNKAGFNISKFGISCESFFAKMVFIDKNLWIKVEDQKKLSLEADLAKSLDISDFQLMGLFDKKGLYIDEMKTLKKTLEWVSKVDHRMLKYQISESDDLISLQYLKLKIFNYYQQNSPVAKKPHNSPEQTLLLQELENLKQNEWKDIIDYLLSKNFTDLEIGFLINTFNDGKFDEIDLRSMELHNDIQIFHLWHLFYLFDYQSELAGNELKKIKDFQVVLDLQEKLDRTDKEKLKQLRKYHLGKQFGFTTVEFTISEIEDKFEVKRERLKALPS